MSFTYLDADQANDAGLEVPDVYYDANYGVSAAMIDGGEWECALDSATGAQYPYIRRHVPNSNTLYDIVSPYGYGGVCGASGSALSDFRRRFLDDGRRRGLVAEFLRTHPIDVGKDIEALHTEAHRWHPTFAISIQESADDYFTAVEGRHRTAVRSALKHGLVVRRSRASSLNDPASPFRRIYAETMQRVGASSRLRLSDDYFRALTNIGDEHVVVLETHSESGTPLASATFLRWKGRLHYHLSGSTREAQNMGATNLLIDHAVRNMGVPGSWLHMGGGVEPGDGLERFKRSAATDSLHVALCQTVVNHTEYDRLCRELGGAPGGYFPAYRARTPSAIRR